MARLPRLLVPHQAHHLIQRGHDRQFVFRDGADHVAFLAWLKEGAKRFEVAIHAYVLMPDHLHLLATPVDAEGLARTMQWVGRYYVPYYNLKYQRRGSLWQGRYKATVLDAERYLLPCSRYIELHPVRTGLVAGAADYPWSSYLHHIGAKPDPLITEHRLYWTLGNTPFDREVVYRQQAEHMLAQAEVEAITQATMKGWALGGEAFKTSLEKQTGRRVSPAKRGRPAKKSMLPQNKKF
ncbi:MAG: transposase [Herbaspirillum sp.]